MANTVYVIKDSPAQNNSSLNGNTGAAVNANTGGASDEVLEEFSAPSLTAAQNVAVNFATLFNHAIVLLQKYGNIGGTLYYYQPNTNLTLTTVPSGITY